MTKTMTMTVTTHHCACDYHHDNYDRKIISLRQDTAMPKEKRPRGTTMMTMTTGPNEMAQGQRETTTLFDGIA